MGAAIKCTNSKRVSFAVPMLFSCIFYAVFLLLTLTSTDCDVIMSDVWVLLRPEKVIYISSVSVPFVLRAAAYECLA